MSQSRKSVPNLMAGWLTGVNIELVQEFSRYIKAFVSRKGVSISFRLLKTLEIFLKVFFVEKGWPIKHKITKL